LNNPVSGSVDLLVIYKRYFLGSNFVQAFNFIESNPWKAVYYIFWYKCDSKYREYSGLPSSIMLWFPFFATILSSSKTPL